MFRCLRITVLVLGLTVVFSSRLIAQEDSGWCISPEKINIQAGTDRRLQLLDDSAQELRDAVWSVSDPDLAEIEEIDGRAVVHAKAVGTVRVSATLGQQTRFRDIKIWPESQPMPAGTTQWGIHPIGREIRDLAAAPTVDGITEMALEQTASGSTYLRGNEADGIQAWTWLMPEKTSDVELVCGDWFGGAVIGANRPGGYTLLCSRQGRQIAVAVYVNMDGFAYVAFTQNEWTLKAGKCAPGSSLDRGHVDLVRTENVMLWQIHPGGTYRSTTVESVRSEQSAGASVNVASPTGALVTDNHDGLLIPIRLSHDRHSQGPSESADELVYPRES